MTNRSSKRRAGKAQRPGGAANDDVPQESPPAIVVPQVGPPANDNPSIAGLPACLEVTDEEVRLLHRYLGRQILALFG